MSLEVIKDALSMLETIGKLPTGAITFTNAIQTIFQVISAVLQADGKEGWSTIANKVLGKGILTLEDEKDLKPLTDLLIQLKNAKPDAPLESLQKGGAINPQPDLNKMYAKGVDAFKGVNKMVSDFAAMSGITKIERTYDRLDDLKPFKPLGGILAVRATGLHETPVPFRLVIFLVNSVLDVARLMVSMPGYDVPLLRKVLSVALAIIELLRGDWKTSLLAFAGVFGSGLVYTGFVYKMFLEIFYMISPPLQNDIVFGAFRVTKSILVGLLLNIFKITATYETRMKAIRFFEELISREKEIDAVLEEKGFFKRGYMDPDDPSGPGLHEFIEDAEWNCSSEFQSAITVAKESPIMRVILQLCNIPTSEDDQECNKFAKHAHQQGYKTWAELLRGEGLQKLMDSDEPPPPPGETEAGPAGSDPKTAAQYAKFKKEIDDLRKEWKKAMDKEEEAERKMVEALGSLIPSTKSVARTPSAPSSLPIGSPIHVDISWAAQQAAAEAAEAVKAVANQPKAPTSS